jgi:hypothetical protein
MAQICDFEVTLTLSTDPARCEKCGAPSRVFVHPGFLCAQCWSLEILRKKVEELSTFARMQILPNS